MRPMYKSMLALLCVAALLLCGLTAALADGHKHTYDSATGVCTVCGEACTHDTLFKINGKEVDDSEKPNYTVVNGYTHKYDVNLVVKEGTCPTCGFVVTEDHPITRKVTIQESHEAGYDTPACPCCGFLCKHEKSYPAGVYYDYYDDDWNLVKFTNITDETHSCVCTKVETYRCDTCGQVVKKERIPNFSLTEPHSFGEGGYCSCGYHQPSKCKHTSTHEVRTCIPYYGQEQNYVRNIDDPENHLAAGDSAVEIYCDDCGALVSEYIPGDWALCLKPHVFDKKGVCMYCGYVKVIEPTDVTISASANDVTVGKKLSLSATVQPEEAKQTVTWSSSDEGIATVSKDGVVNGKKRGTVTITAEASNGVKGTVKLKVVAPTPEKITISSPKKSVTVGKKLSLEVTLSPKNAETKLTWTSSNTKIATVSKSGVVKGKKPGAVKITATASNGVKKTIELKVVAPTPDKVTISSSKKSVKVGKKLSLKVALSPKNAETKLTWTSSDTKIATVSKNGVVKGKKPGTVTITVKTSNGKKAKIKITVKK